jgi:hypothetical protein
VSSPLNPEQFTTLYHGTSPDNVDSIRSEGLKPPESVQPAMWPMLTTSRDQAARYGRGAVVEYSVPSHVMDYRHPEGALWPGQSHDVYGHDATAYGIKGALPGKYIKKVHQ